MEIGHDAILLDETLVDWWYGALAGGKNIRPTIGTVVHKMISGCMCEHEIEANNIFIEDNPQLDSFIREVCQVWAVRVAT